MSGQIEIPLYLKRSKPRQGEVEGLPYMVGSSDLPIQTDLRDITFFVYFPPEGEDVDDRDRRGTLILRPYRPKPSENDR